MPTREQADQLFQIISKRVETGITLVTTNLGPSQWGNVLGSVTASAILDRLSEPTEEGMLNIVNYDHAFPSQAEKQGEYTAMDLNGPNYALPSFSGQLRSTSERTTPIFCLHGAKMRIVNEV